MITGNDVKQFLNQMDADMAEAHRMAEAEDRLHDAVLNYEKVFGVKIKIPLATEEVKA